MSDINAINFPVTQPSTSGTRADGLGNSAFVKQANTDFKDLVRQIAKDKTAADRAAAAKERADAAAAKAAETKAANAKANAKAADKTADTTEVTADSGTEETILTTTTDTDTDAALAFDLRGTGDTTTLNADGLKTLKAALESLLHGLPADQKPVAIKLNITQLQKIMQGLKANAGDIQDNEKSLIATGLSPEQLTKLSALIGQATNQADTENTDPSADDGLKAVLIGILKLVPEEDNGKAEIFLPKTLMVTKDEKSVKLGDKDKDDDNILVTSLNALIVDVTPPAPAPTGPMDTSGIKEGGIDSGAIAPDKKGAGFGDVLKLLEQIQTKTAPGTEALTGQQAKTDATVPASGALNSTTGMSFSDVFGGLTSDGGLDSMFPNGLDWSKTNNQYGLSNVQVTSPAQLTSLVTQTTATQSHPATQVVAATLARTFEGGETKHLTLRLDPPELGKIEIQMQFTKDKSVKTHMIFEKPETMLMMQRDSRTLELAMQNAGMDAGGNSLSFELGSQNNNDFTHGQGGNNGSSGSHRSADSGEPQLIETTMSWSVDAETGMKHYNTLV